MKEILVYLILLKNNKINYLSMLLFPSEFNDLLSGAF